MIKQNSRCEPRKFWELALRAKICISSRKFSVCSLCEFFCSFSGTLKIGATVHVSLSFDWILIIFKKLILINLQKIINQMTRLVYVQNATHTRLPPTRAIDLDMYGINLVVSDLENFNFKLRIKVSFKFRGSIVRTLMERRVHSSGSRLSCDKFISSSRLIAPFYFEVLDNDLLAYPCVTQRFTWRCEERAKKTLKVQNLRSTLIFGSQVVYFWYSFAHSDFVCVLYALKANF
jgi:hypothetical protein